MNTANANVQKENLSPNDLARIHCDVTSCEYNDKKMHCIASSINVGPGNVNTKDQTLCATFTKSAY